MIPSSASISIPAFWNLFQRTPILAGENGEFHTFVYDSPAFSHAIPVEMGEVVKRDGFLFADVLPSAE
jgi:diphthamide synthase (EF-2-diphthine--ammonia ligase)